MASGTCPPSIRDPVGASFSLRPLKRQAGSCPGAQAVKWHYQTLAVARTTGELVEHPPLTSTDADSTGLGQGLGFFTFKKLLVLVQVSQDYVLLPVQPPSCCELPERVQCPWVKGTLTQTPNSALSRSHSEFLECPFLICLGSFS